MMFFLKSYIYKATKIIQNDKLIPKYLKLITKLSTSIFITTKQRLNTEKTFRPWGYPLKVKVI